MRSACTCARVRVPPVLGGRASVRLGEAVLVVDTRSRAICFARSCCLRPSNWRKELGTITGQSERGVLTLKLQEDDDEEEEDARGKKLQSQVPKFWGRGRGIDAVLLSCRAIIEKKQRQKKIEINELRYVLLQISKLLDISKFTLTR